MGAPRYGGYVTCGLCVFIFIYIIDALQCINFGAEASLKVLEHNKEQLSYKKRIWLELCVCDKGTWTTGSYGSYCLKVSCEDRVLGYNTLARKDASINLIIIVGM